MSLSERGCTNGPIRIMTRPRPPLSEGAYEDNCPRDNAAGRSSVRSAGGLIGSAASHGHGGAVVGGAILAACSANAITRDMPCEDHPTPCEVYAQGLDGDIGHRYACVTATTTAISRRTGVPPRRLCLPFVQRDDVLHGKITRARAQPAGCATATGASTNRRFKMANGPRSKGGVFV